MHVFDGLNTANGPCPSLSFSLLSLSPFTPPLYLLIILSYKFKQLDMYILYCLRKKVHCIYKSLGEKELCTNFPNHFVIILLLILLLTSLLLLPLVVLKSSFYFLFML